jgi:UDP-N-acetylglucosamine acyltransferase
MKHSHVGHDAELKDGVTLSCGAKIGGHSIIGENTNIGLNAVIHQKVEVPEGCMIGASGFVGKKSVLKPFTKYAGVPVKEIGSNAR